MRRVLFACVVHVTFTATPPSAASTLVVTVDATEILAHTSPLLHGVAIDTFSLSKGLDFTDPDILRPSTTLAPPLLRVGGSAQRGYPTCFTAAHPEPMNATCLTRLYWAELCKFAGAIGTKLVYGLDAYDLTGSLTLIAELRTTSACPALYGFSIGNEGCPGSNSSFWTVRAAIDAAFPSPAHKPLLIGTDTPIMPDNMNYFVPMSTRLLREMGGAIDAASFHVYTFNSYMLDVKGVPTVANLLKGNLSHFWDPTYLELVGNSVQMWKKVLANASHPKLPMWLSESNSICSGGVDGLSNTYSNSLWLLNQFGQVAAGGVQVMAQQTLVGEDYGLLSGAGDRTQAAGWLNNITARPNYFISMLHQKLTGDVVFNTSIAAAVCGAEGRVLPAAAAVETSNSSSSNARSYAYCAGPNAGAPAGAITVVLINFDEHPNQFTFAISAASSGGSRNGSARKAKAATGQLLVYALLGLPKPFPAAAPSPEEIISMVTSPSVYLNGATAPLQPGDNLDPIHVGPSESVSLSGLGAALVVWPDAGVSWCK
jgi:hypothetical protein